MDTKDGIEAVKSRKSMKKFIHGTKGQDFKLPLIVENISNGVQFPAMALINSGATGSCINHEFVEHHQILIKWLPFKMAVYNAGGSIEGFVSLKMIIGDHAKRIELAVTNLRKIDVFLSLNWLKHHNPTIDWKEATVLFNKCPMECSHTPW